MHVASEIHDPLQDLGADLGTPRISPRRHRIDRAFLRTGVGEIPGIGEDRNARLAIIADDTHLVPEAGQEQAGSDLRLLPGEIPRDIVLGA